MTRQEPREINPGAVVEFFEAKEILTGVCLAVKNQRYSILTEQNKEINLSRSRLIHAGGRGLDLQQSRDDLVRKLGEITTLRKKLMEQVSAEALWTLTEGEALGFDAHGLAEFTFSEAVTDDHVAAVQRVMLQDRLFFQFKDAQFFPRSQEKVDLRRIEMEREEERQAQLDQGSAWLQAVWTRKQRPPSPEFQDILVEDLKSFCLFGQESPSGIFVKELFKRAGIPPQPQSAFRLMVRLGIWDENENLYLHEQNISPEFPPGLIEYAEKTATASIASSMAERRDLRDLHTFTVDSALTRDYDDALSLRVLDNGLYEVGIHIADAAHFVTRGDLLDLEAQERASSIYLPDSIITMLPASLSEGVCSLRAGEDRLAMSFLLRINAEGVVQEHEIVSSVVRVREQMTYDEVSQNLDKAPFLRALYDLALKLRQERLDRGAVILPLPEIQVYVNPAGMIQISRYDKETPSQIMVSEWMIAANAQAGAFLAERGVPAIFRNQAECKQETDFTQSEHELFRVYRQRRLFARAELDTEPKMHCSLAVPQYTTVTSPIRRYWDLVAQRQLKHVLAGQEAAYSEEELRQLITKLGAVQTKIFYIQRKWTRYWILKYIEQEDLSTMSALVLDQNDRFAHLLLPELLIEANILLSDKTRLQPGEQIRVKIERLNPREDILRLQL